MSLLPSIRPSSDWTPIRALAVPLWGELPGVHCGRPVAQFCSDQVQIRVLANRYAIDEWLTAAIGPDQVEHFTSNVTHLLDGSSDTKHYSSLLPG